MDIKSEIDIKIEPTDITRDGIPKSRINVEIKRELESEDDFDIKEEPLEFNTDEIGIKGECQIQNVISRTSKVGGNAIKEKRHSDKQIDHVEKENDNSLTDYQGLGTVEFSDKPNLEGINLQESLYKSKFPIVLLENLEIEDKKIYNRFKVTLFKGGAEVSSIGSKIEGPSVSNNVFDELTKRKKLNPNSKKKLNGIYECSNCDYKSKDSGNFNRHLLIHSSFKLFKCHLCHYECKRKSYMKIHVLNHSDLRRYQCSLCYYQTNRSEKWKIHLLNHSKERRYRCDSCPYKTNVIQTLKRHLLTHANVESVKIAKRSQNRVEENVYKCSSCDYSTNVKRNLARHSKKHSGTELFSCADCHYGTIYKSHLRRHMSTHSKPSNAISCVHCKLEFKDEQKRAAHLSKLTSKLFRCLECCFQTNLKNGLKMHSPVHSKEKKWHCSQCTFKTRYESSLKTHTLSHKESKRFKCLHCRYQSNFKHHLQTHLLKHGNP